MKKLDRNYTRMLCAVLIKFWKKHSIKLQLYRHLLPISQSIQERQIKYTGHCWRSKDELISNILLWTCTHGHISVSQQVRTYIHHLFADTGWSLEDLPGVMDDRDGWWEYQMTLWFELVLWHINHCRLFNAKSSLYIILNIYDLLI